MRQKVFSIFLVAACFSAATAMAAPETLTLEGSIERAVKASTPILKAEKDADVRGDALLQGYLQFLPNLTVQGGYNELQGRSFLTTAAPTLVRGKSDGFNYSVTSTLNIFNGLSDYSAFKSARDKKSAADKTFERAKQAIALDIAQSFLQVILDDKLRIIAENNFKTSQDREKLLDAQTKVGSRSLSDLFRQQAQTAVDEQSLIAARNKLETDKITFLKKLRMDPRADVIFQEPKLDQDINAIRKAGEIPLNSDNLTTVALSNRPDYEASQKTASATQADVGVAQAPYYPRLDLFATYASLSRDYDYQRVNGVDVTPPDQENWRDQLADHGNTTVGLALTWSIFDRYVTTSTVAQARGVAYKAKLDAEDYRNQVIGEVRQVLNDRSTAIQQLVTTQIGVTAAQKAFEVTEGRFGVGALSFVDLSVAQTQLFQAQASFAQAIINFELQKRAMVYVLGSNTPLTAGS